MSCLPVSLFTHPRAVGGRLACLTLGVCLLTACGSDSKPDGTATDTSTAQDIGLIEVIGGDVEGTPDTGTADAASAVDTSGPDTATVEDTSSGEEDAGWFGDLGSGLPFDVNKPDIPYEALTVVSTSPATDGTSPDFKALFTVTMSKDINEQTVEDYTVIVTGTDGSKISGLVTSKGPVISFVADSDLPPATRVIISITTLVQDAKGQTLKDAYDFHVHTPGYANTAPYEKLARRYAPDIRQSIKIGKSDLLRGLAYDGDWKAANNDANIGTDPTADVSWAVAETQSHFYIHYVYYWPTRAKTKTQQGYTNDTAGATVIVRRYPSEQPIALETWFKNSSDERKWLWVTSDSELLPKGKKPSAVNIRGVLPLDTLFPKADDGFGCAGIKGCTARRFPAFLTGDTHQSCLWPDVGDKTPSICATDAYSKTQMNLIRYMPAEKPTVAKPAGAKPGTKLPTFLYALTPLFDTWFPRRASTDLFVKPLSFSYKAPAGRPIGPKLSMGSKFLGGGSDFGRPPWAFRWKPANNSNYYDLPRGTVFFDPAFALWSRIGGKTSGLAAYDAKTKKGVSLAYCFAPFLFIDQRDIAACKDSLKTP